MSARHRRSESARASLRAAVAAATLLLLAGVPAGACGASDGAPTASRATSQAAARHLIYLHGRIVQERQDPRPTHPQYGTYELEAILAAFRRRGFAVEGGIRPKDETVAQSAARVVDEVRRLRASGVPSGNITIVGASMGASIAFDAAVQLADPDLRVVVLGECLSENVRSLLAESGRAPAGHLLSIHEASDDTSEPCPAWESAAALRKQAGTLRAREILLHTGLRHGFLYRPLPEWVEPAVAWARGVEGSEATGK